MGYVCRQSGVRTPGLVAEISASGPEWSPLCDKTATNSSVAGDVSGQGKLSKVLSDAPPGTLRSVGVLLSRLSEFFSGGKFVRGGRQDRDNEPCQSGKCASAPRRLAELCSQVSVSAN